MKRIALSVLGVGSPLILIAMLVGGAFGRGLFVVISLSFPVAISALAPGSYRRGRMLVLLALLLSLELSALGLFVVSPEMTLGLPRSTWLMLLGFALVPLILVSFGYAATHRTEETE